jgi:hypothetical protein
MFGPAPGRAFFARAPVHPPERPSGLRRPPRPSPRRPPQSPHPPPPGAPRAASREFRKQEDGGFPFTPPGRPARARAQVSQSPRARGGAGRFRWMGRPDASGEAAGAGRCGRSPAAMRRIRPTRRGIDARAGPAAARGRRGLSHRPAGRAAFGLGARGTGESAGRRPREASCGAAQPRTEEPVADCTPRG